MELFLYGLKIAFFGIAVVFFILFLLIFTVGIIKALSNSVKSNKAITTAPLELLENKTENNAELDNNLIVDDVPIAAIMAAINMMYSSEVKLNNLSFRVRSIKELR